MRCQLNCASTPIKLPVRLKQASKSLKRRKVQIYGKKMKANGSAKIKYGSAKIKYNAQFATDRLLVSSISKHDNSDEIGS